MLSIGVSGDGIGSWDRRRRRLVFQGFILVTTSFYELELEFIHPLFDKLFRTPSGAPSSPDPATSNKGKSISKLCFLASTIAFIQCEC
jgi:hypothetical protein